ncbi:MAG: DUF4422 domain-containing protein [Deltaproteobacteria bacterium]|nr:DUF4422 domain-containing protein [Deltaproteobacteria bacterium]
MPDCAIVVATHKPYWMPSAPMYLPLHVGAAGKADIGFTRDDAAPSISEKNPWYCEVSGMYWAWKHLEAAYVGLAQYRRHFSLQHFVFGTAARKKAVIGSEELAGLLKQDAVLLPSRRHYFIESRKQQFANAHGAESLAALEHALRTENPGYLPAYAKSMERTWGHIYNMFIMRRDIFHAYCTWLFPVLELMEAKLLQRLGVLPPRIIGFAAERLLDVWLLHNRVAYAEIGYVTLEPVNWPKKICGFLMRKFRTF